ncbi:unnamed protein product, partial [Choristocarpus tenellus]
MFAAGCVDWWSRKPKTDTLSTAEAEYLYMFCNRLMRVNLYQCLRVVMISLRFAQKAVSGVRTKHTNVRYHYVGLLEKEGKIAIGYLPTNFQYAYLVVRGPSKGYFN